MIVTQKKLREHCTIIKQLKLERFFIKQEDNYFTLYEKNGNIVGIVLEVSFSNMWMQEDELWGIINRNIRGNNIFIEECEFNKIVQIEQEKKNELMGQTKKISKKIIRVEEKLGKEKNKK